MASAGSIFVDLLLRDSSYNKGWNNARRTTNSGVSAITSKLGVLAASFATLFSGREIIRISDRFASLESRLRLVSENASVAAQSLDRLYSVSQVNRQPFDEAVNGYIRLAQSLNEYQRQSFDIIQISDLLSQTLRISGADAAGAASFYQQFGQAASSNFQAIGQELQTFADQNPVFYKIIREEAEKAGSTLKEFAADGKLSFELVANALINNAEEINRQSQSIATTVGQAGTVLANSFANYIRLSPDVNRASEIIASSIIGIADAFDLASRSGVNFTTAVGGIISAYYQFELSAQEAKLAAYEFFNLPDSVISKQKSYIEDLQGLLNGLGDELREINSSGEIDITTSSGVGATLIEPPSLSATKEALKAAAKREKELESLYKSNRVLIEGLSAETIRYLDTAEELKELYEAGRISEEQFNLANIRLKQQFDELNGKAEDTFFDLEAISKRASENMQDAFAEFLFDPFQDGLDGMLRGFVDTMRKMLAEQAASSLLKTIAGSALGGVLNYNLGTGSLESQVSGSISSNPDIFGSSNFGGFFADGGYLEPGKWGIVGEEGAEMIYGGKSGATVVPNKDMGNTYNIDARGADEGAVRRVESALLSLAGPGVIEKRVSNAQRRGAL